MDVRALREEFGLSQEQLAKLSNIPRDRISKWEQAKGSPKYEDTLRLTDIEAILRMVRIHVKVQLGLSKEEIPKPIDTLVMSHPDQDHLQQKNSELHNRIQELREHIKTLTIIRDDQKDIIQKLDINLMKVLENQQRIKTEVAVAFRVLLQQIVGADKKEELDAISDEFDTLLSAALHQ